MDRQTEHGTALQAETHADRRRTPGGKAMFLDPQQNPPEGRHAALDRQHAAAVQRELEIIVVTVSEDVLAEVCSSISWILSAA